MNFKPVPVFKLSEEYLIHQEIKNNLGDN